jgi:hypothetical protein
MQSLKRTNAYVQTLMGSCWDVTLSILRTSWTKRTSWEWNYHPAPPTLSTAKSFPFHKASDQDHSRVNSMKDIGPASINYLRNFSRARRRGHKWAAEINARFLHPFPCHNLGRIAISAIRSTTWTFIVGVNMLIWTGRTPSRLLGRLIPKTLHELETLPAAEHLIFDQKLHRLHLLRGIKSAMKVQCSAVELARIALSPLLLTISL